MICQMILFDLLRTAVWLVFNSLVLMLMQGPSATKTIPPVPTAAHVRTMRKGSTDHLALDVDLESAGLINSEQSDEDKGAHLTVMPSFSTTLIASTPHIVFQSQVVCSSL